MEVQEITDREEWNRLVDQFDGHPLQYWGWGELKAAHGWRAMRVAFGQLAQQIGGVQVLVKTLPMGATMFFVPRGPFGQDQVKLLTGLKDFARTKGAKILKIEPEWLKNQSNTEILQKSGFKATQNHVFIPNTAEINLADMEGRLERLGKKTRQYINKSMRDLETREIGADKLDQVVAIYQMTAKRAGFAIHPKEYYAELLEAMGQQNRLYAAFADDDQMVAFLWNIASKTSEFELYGGVNEIGQQKRANYGLKWSAIKASYERGAKFYDLNGLLNQGIDQFKRNFIFENEEKQRVGTWDYYPSVSGKLLNTAMEMARKLRRAVK